MSLTIDEMYEAANNGETSWEHALLLTGLLYMGMTGLEVSPPPMDKNEYYFYKLRLDSLSKYPNNNNHYKNVMKTLHNYIHKKELMSNSYY